MTSPNANTLPSGPFHKLKQSNIAQAWLVLTLAICFGASLAGVQLKLGPVIEANKLNETLEKVPELVLGAELSARMAAQNQKLTITPRTIAVEQEGRTTYYSVYETSYQGDPKGFVVKAAGQGYADKVELLMGLDPKIKTITGLFVLEQKETPGLGNKIIEPKWRGQFTGKKTAPALSVTKTGAAAPNEIDAVTGATISSRTVTNIVNGAIAALQGPLTEKQK